MSEIPKKYRHLDAEKKWKERWEQDGTYHWDPEKDRDHTFSIDTPPPTVSGSLHIGHVFSYTHTDILARYQRMIGKNVFYPMGWDDNGLPTERRVQNVFGIECDPTLAYDAHWKPNAQHKKKRHEYEKVSRQNFIEACGMLTQEDEKVFEELWRQLGLSVDWRLQYATIDPHCMALSQRSFLDLVAQNNVKSVDSPSMWDVDFQTAVAQAEVEDRMCPGAYHHIRFACDTGDDFVIATTRPELLAACIAVVAHPDDERYKSHFGHYATTPLYHAKVPILPSEHADPEKGTGILMVCTFGDGDDVAWWKQSSLAIKQVVGRNGCMLPVTFGEGPFTSENSALAQQHYNEIVGLRLKKARAKVAQMLQEPTSSVDGTQPALAKDIEVIEHPVKFYEKGDTPIELIPTRQWFIDILSYKKELIEQGNAIAWHPSHMKTRYQNWVEGLNQDWCISRQRYFGVPFPVWYPCLEDGSPNYNAPIFADGQQLPIDPLTDVPPGYEASQRNQPGGFCGDTDVMDTWATSSLTPQLTSHWTLDNKRHNAVFPMDIRPQSHEIIRTWAFYTIVKAWMHEQKIPWKHVVISGWILDPDRKKMSKSKGNVVTPGALLEQYSSDAVRYWTAKARLGTDTAFDETVFTVGQKLVTKLVNMSKFVMMQTADFKDLSNADITEPVDQDLIAHHRELISRATDAFDAFDYAAALDACESGFWMFCDHYLELVKTRAYRDESLTKRRSALATLHISCRLFIRLFAPFLPFVTEEIGSWGLITSGSIHRSSWPQSSEFSDIAPPQKEGVLTTAIEILTEIRGAKSQAQKNMKHVVEQLDIHCDDKVSEQLNLVITDLYNAGSIASHEIHTHSDEPTPRVAVILAD